MIEDIPLYLVLDALSQASHNVSILLKLQLDVPPIKRADVRIQGDDSYLGNSTQQMSIDSTPVSIVQVFEVWEVLLDVDAFDLEKVYVVIGARYRQEGYRGGTWSDVEYEGFYTTLEEAKNEINGYLA